VGVLQLDDDSPPDGAIAEPVGAYSDAAATAVRLFEALRSLDRAGCDVLFTRELADPDTGIGKALADRLRRAATRVIES
jgi:hypothetical protein